MYSIYDLWDANPIDAVYSFNSLLLNFYASVTVEKRIEPYTLYIRLSFTLFDTNTLLEFPIVYLHANMIT